MILVTGASGLVGRATVTELARQGLPCLAVAKSHVAPTGVPSVVHDLAGRLPLQEAVPTPPSIVAHLAAVVPHSADQPDSPHAGRQTERIDDQVLAAALTWGCPVVYASSCGLYDRLDHAWKDEETSRARATGPYFAAKLRGEGMFLRIPGSTALRLSAPVGPGMRAGLVLSRFVCAARTASNLRVWGSGAREQDFIDARDCARAVLAACRVCPGGTFNVASARPITMLNLAKAVIEVIGAGSIELCGLCDPRELETARYPISKAEASLGWRPEITLHDAIHSVATENFRR